MSLRRSLFVATGLLCFAAPAIAADMGDVRHPDGSIGNPAAASSSSSFGIEASPEFHARSSGDTALGNYADTAVKASLSHSFGNNVVVGVSLQGTFKESGDQQWYAEASVGYKIKLDWFTLTPSAAIGDTWDATGLGEDGNANAVYYALYLAGDAKLSPQWTWNAFNLRWRDAFDYQWQTPKISTGLSFAVTPQDTLTGTIGYSWKDTGDGMLGDKMNIAFGYKRGF